MIAVEDRRVRRTRRLLRGALLELAVEKGYDKVTVQDVLDRADVGRATFYAHFRDKDDLLVSGAEELRESLRRRMAEFAAGQRDDPAAERLDVARVLFEHAARHRRLYRGLMGKRGADVIRKYAHQDLSALFREHFDDVVARRNAKPAVPVDVTVHFVVSALLAVLTWWLDNDVNYSAEDMAAMFHRLIAHGLFGLFDAPPSPHS